MACSLFVDRSIDGGRMLTLNATRIALQNDGLKLAHVPIRIMPRAPHQVDNNQLVFSCSLL